MKLQDVTYIVPTSPLSRVPRSLPRRLAHIEGIELDTMSARHMLCIRFRAPGLSFNGMTLSSMSISR